MIVHPKCAVGRYSNVCAFSRWLVRAWLASLPVVCLHFLAASASGQSNNLAAFTWTTFVGKPSSGSADGVGGAAQFGGPTGVAVDPAGNVYVADEGNEEIRKITPAGVVTTIAGYAGSQGTNDGVGSAARFMTPMCITMDTVGNLYVTDSYNYTVRKLMPLGTNWAVTTIAGLPGVPGSVDGTNSGARFVRPKGICADSTGALFVIDDIYAVRKITPTGTNWVVRTVAGLAGNYGGADGLGTNASFSSLTDVTVDSGGTIYVADGLLIRELTPSGTNYQVTTIQANGFGFEGIFGLAGAGTGVLDMMASEAIMRFTISGTTGTINILAGTTNIPGYADGTGLGVKFAADAGVAVDTAGNLYVADAGNQVIRKSTTAGVVRTLAGTVQVSGNDVDGTGTGARLNSPTGLTVDSTGTVYFSENQGNNTIREVSSAGVVSTVAGTMGTTGTNDGTGNNARFNEPGGLAVQNGTIFVADSGNDTIREISTSGVVSTIAGLAGVTGTNDGVGNVARFSRPSGVAMDAGGSLYVADTGGPTIRQMRLVLIRGFPLPLFGWSVTTIAGLGGHSGSVDGVGTNARFMGPIAIAVDANTNLYVFDGENSLRKVTPVGSTWVVSTITTFTNFSRDNAGGIAVDGSGDVFVARPPDDAIEEFSPSGNSYVFNVIGGIGNGTSGSRDGAGNQAQFSGPVGIALDGNGNLFVADKGNGTIRQGIFTAFNSADTIAYVRPPTSASLTVTLIPPEANGQWRFPWELAWRNSGQAATNLMTANYPVEFRQLPGWLPLPGNLTVAVSGNVSLTNQYYPTSTTVDTNTGGSLTVTLGPSPPAGAGWRFLGDTTAFYPSGFTTNLNAGTYLIEFAAVSGRTKPPNSSVQVFAGQPTFLAENYLLASSPPSAQVELPFPVPTNQINDVVDFPFANNGQLQSDTGYGSGVAVEANVVLTAAHVVFNDQTLAYVSQAYWYFQEETGLFMPEPQAVRGFYLLSGYAVQRSNDLQIYSPDTSTPQSRNLDVAALYFLSPMAGGGFGGYLPSDQSPNQWLTGNSLKMLVGYPVDGSMFGDASIVPGLMYQIQPQPYPLTLATDPVANQRVYTAPWFLSYPGNSGGPVYAQFNGYYYTAGVYLGTLFNGSQPYASLVLGIDSDVVNLITNASALGDSGTNNTGGGVVTVIPNQNVSAANPGYMQWHLSPPAVVSAGAAWRLQGDANYSTSSNYTRVVTTTNAVVVQFKPVAGWNLPVSQGISVAPGQVTTYSANYTVVNPTLVASPQGIGLTGTMNTTYRINRTFSLLNPTWTPVSTNTIITSGFNLAFPLPTNSPAAYYRAVWLGN